jgi:hypothetical protein
MKIGHFLLRQMFSWTFWQLFIASFTIVLMMAWRAALRDKIFKDGIGK